MELCGEELQNSGLRRSVMIYSAPTIKAHQTRKFSNPNKILLVCKFPQPRQCIKSLASMYKDKILQKLDAYKDKWKYKLLVVSNICCRALKCSWKIFWLLRVLLTVEIIYSKSERELYNVYFEKEMKGKIMENLLYNLAVN